ncbi:hypothetical protein EBR37_04285, partial [bacterium]|nr:hypothetical protein [bacterium]
VSVAGMTSTNQIVIIRAYLDNTTVSDELRLSRFKYTPFQLHIKEKLEQFHISIVRKVLMTLTSKLGKHNPILTGKKIDVIQRILKLISRSNDSVLLILTHYGLSSIESKDQALDMLIDRLISEVSPIPEAPGSDIGASAEIARVRSHPSTLGELSLLSPTDRREFLASKGESSASAIDVLDDVPVSGYPTKAIVDRMTDVEVKSEIKRQNLVDIPPGETRARRDVYIDGMPPEEAKGLLLSKGQFSEPLRNFSSGHFEDNRHQDITFHIRSMIKQVLQPDYDALFESQSLKRTQSTPSKSESQNKHELLFRLIAKLHNASREKFDLDHVTSLALKALDDAHKRLDRVRGQMQSIWGDRRPIMDTSDPTAFSTGVWVRLH